MKRLVLLLFCFFIFWAWTSFSQNCPVCTIDLTCDSVPAAPKLCPANLPADTAGNYYSADLTFFVPKFFIHPVYDTVVINQIDVIGVTNLPPGMSWAAYNYLGVSTTSFFPNANPPSSERGCAKLCGTPPLPFDDSIYVSTIAYVYVPSFNTSTTQNATFGIYLKIVPNSSGNNSFTMSNNVECGSLNASFSVLNPSNGNLDFHYQWNFGNGLQSISENPTAQTYDLPGSYAVSLQTTIDTFPYTLTQIAVTNVGCTDIGTDPDLFLKIFDGNGNLVLSTLNSPVSGTLPLTWNLATELTNPIYTLQVWDADSAEGQGNDDNCINGSEASQGGIALLMPPPGQYGNTVQTGTNQNLSLNYTINKPVIIFNDTSVVNVYPIPDAPVVLYVPDDSACVGDSLLLWVDGGFSGYQWYTDSVLLTGENDSFYLATTTGNYWVKINNSYGCSANSNLQPITFIQNPPKPAFISIGNNTLKTFMSGYPLQWYFNGSPIPGATGQTYTYTATGYYKLSTRNIICLTFSDSVQYTYVGLEENLPFNSLTVFPNPNNGNFIIKFEVLKITDIEISITDILGRKVFEEFYKNISGSFSENINFSETDAGIYLMKISSGGQSMHNKLVLQK